METFRRHFWWTPWLLAIAIGFVAYKAPCDDGFWTGFKMASGIYCSIK